MPSFITAASAVPTDDLFAGGGEMGRRMREYDWASHPLGPPERWPQSFRTAIRILLTSRYAMWLGWGEGFWFFYNDTYQPTLGMKDERALGARTEEVWSEVWPAIESRATIVFGKREATWDEGLRLFLQRSGYREETYHTFSYSPLANDDGSVGGMLCVVTEETERVIGQRRLAMLRELAAELAQTKTEDEVFAAAQRCMTAHPEDVPFALAYALEPQSDAARLVRTHGIEPGHPIAPVVLHGDAPWPVRELLARRELIVTDLSTQADLPTGVWDRPPSRAVIVPLQEAGQSRPSGFLVVGLNPYRPYAEPYRGFIQLLAGQISASLNSARAFEAERKRAAALAEIDRAKTEFFSNVSHEFRTPLTLMLGPLEEELRLRHVGNERIETAHRNALRLLKLVNSLLDFSRSEAGRLQATYTPTDLGSFTRELASSFESLIAKAGLVYRIDCPPLPADTWIDREMWEKIIFNLLSNAFKFTFSGEIVISARAHAESVEVVVSDTGTGIPAEALPRLFERFHRVQGARSRSYEGTGIGLALVQQLVRLHGGDIRVESTEGKGTRFTLTLRKGSAHLPPERLSREIVLSPPSNRAAAFVEEASRWIPEALPPAPEVATPSSTRILLIDDNADMRDYVQRLLAPHYTVATATDGEAGLAAIRAAPPDLVLSDVMMPRLDGFGLLRAVRADPALSAIPVILLSARAGEESRIEGLEQQADDYLVKPFTARELLARIHTHLDLLRIRRESQSRVLDSEQRLRLAIEAGQLGLWEIDPQTAAVQQDARSLQILGRRESARDLAEALDAVHPEDTERVRFKLARALDPVGDGRFEDEHRILVPGTQEVRWVRAAGLATFSAGQPRAFSGTLLDITQLMRARETLAERQGELERLVEERTAELRDTVAELEGFSYSVSHDLRAPLRAMQSFAQLLAEDYATALDETGRDYLKRIVNASHRMDQLIHDVLVYSRVARTELALEPVDLERVIDGVVESHPQLQANAADVTIARPLPAVLANEAALTQCLANLLSNAAKFVAPGTRPRIEIDAVEASGRIRLRVRDYGIGIAPEFHQKIFGVFERLSRDYEGTGIGLAVVRKAAERMGGSVSLQSEVGAGSTFTLELAASK